MVRRTARLAACVGLWLIAPAAALSESEWEDRYRGEWPRHLPLPSSCDGRGCGPETRGPGDAPAAENRHIFSKGHVVTLMQEVYVETIVQLEHIVKRVKVGARTCVLHISPSSGIV